MLFSEAMIDNIPSDDTIIFVLVISMLELIIKKTGSNTDSKHCYFDVVVVGSTILENVSEISISTRNNKLSRSEMVSDLRVILHIGNGRREYGHSAIGLHDVPPGQIGKISQIDPRIEELICVDQHGEGKIKSLADIPTADNNKNCHCSEELLSHSKSFHRPRRRIQQLPPADHQELQDETHAVRRGIAQHEGTFSLSENPLHCEHKHSL